MAVKPLFQINNLCAINPVDDKPGVREISASVEVTWPGNVIDLSNDADVNLDVFFAEKARGLLSADVTIFDGCDTTDAEKALEGAISIVMTAGPSWSSASRGQADVRISCTLAVSILMPATRADLLLGRSALREAVAAIVDPSVNP